MKSVEVYRKPKYMFFTSSKDVKPDIVRSYITWFWLTLQVSEFSLL